MTTAYFIYSQDAEGRLNLYYTINTISSIAFTTIQSRSNRTPFEDILSSLNIDEDSERITYLGTFTFDKMSNDEIDAIAINVSSINMKNFIAEYKLKENPSHQMGREENSFILAMFAKLIIEKTKYHMVKTK